MTISIRLITARLIAARKHLISIATVIAPVAAHLVAPELELIAFVIVGVLAVEAV